MRHILLAEKRFDGSQCGQFYTLYMEEYLLLIEVHAMKKNFYQKHLFLHFVGECEEAKQI